MTNWKTHKYDNSMVGKKFQKLNVLEVIPYYRGNQRQYKCKIKCDNCERESEMTIDAVIKGCGVCKKCAHKIKPSGFSNNRTKDITGKRFGNLVAIKPDDNVKNKPKGGGVYWICKCDCGNEKSIMGKRLRKGEYISCGCQHHVKGEKNPSWKGYREISGKYWKNLERNAIERKFNFDLTLEEAWDIFVRQDKKCALTGIEIQLTEPKNASLDRIDSNKGYTKDNVQWVHLQINRMKWAMSDCNFQDWCEKVYRYKNEKTT